MSLITDGPFKGLPYKHFGVVLADPPWQFVTRSLKNQDRLPGYRVMTLDDIKALPIKDLLRKDGVVLCWVIDSHLQLAMGVIDAWGIKYKTVGFYWVKTNADGTPFTGMGFWTRANPEQCWLAEEQDEANQWLLSTTGSPKRIAKNVKRLIMAPRREHSRKPDELFPRIEALCGGPYLELFSRESRPGWSHWGDESGRFDTNPLPDDLQALLGWPANPRVSADLQALI